MRDKAITIVAVLVVLGLVWTLNKYLRPGEKHTPKLTRDFSSEANAQTEGEKNMIAVVETNMGTFSFELYSDDAPQTVASFIKLAKKGFYDGLIFHRVIDGFMIQGGDPTGTGSGGQFYMCLAPTPHLDGKYTVFGQVVDGLDVVLAIGKVATDGRDRPLEKVVMEKVTIREEPPEKE